MEDNKPKLVVWKLRSLRERELQKKIQDFNAPKVIEEYEENGIVIKRYEAR